MTASDTSDRPLVRRIFASILGLIGLVLTVGGAMLLSKGGSPYYLLTGLATAASGWFVWRRNPNGARVYAAMLVGTIAWALWESGLDGWALAPRLAAPAVLGVRFVLSLAGMVMLRRIASWIDSSALTFSRMSGLA